MFSPSEVLELVMLCRQTAHSATDFSPMDGNATLKKMGAPREQIPSLRRCGDLEHVVVQVHMDIA